MLLQETVKMRYLPYCQASELYTSECFKISRPLLNRGKNIALQTGRSVKPCKLMISVCTFSTVAWMSFWNLGIALKLLLSNAQISGIQSCRIRARTFEIPCSAYRTITVTKRCLMCSKFIRAPLVKYIWNNIFTAGRWAYSLLSTYCPTLCPEMHTIRCRHCRKGCPVHLHN